ncbi:hypothetical protein [Sphingosinicella soli]|uniref:Uncharacterized protein n=1 Tax=Sphingosinicella soli TaxID=333708 RepID=A0A7W7B0C3_9SPHN|nr:hypothetical protein [Sphingosinicella soli]MBB4630647.1 hypothetical protein [Sphingosinicella soli]
MKPPAPLDLVAAIRLALSIFWAQFAPIIFLGLLFLTLPAVALRTLSIATEAAPDPALGTIVETLRWMLVMIFLCAVTGGVLARNRDPRAFMKAGLRGLQPGLVVALTIGIGLMTLRIVLLLASRMLQLGQMSSLLFIVACIAAFAVWALAVPAALSERLWPMAALRRAAELSKGSRWQLSALCIVIMLALTPAIMVVRFAVFHSAQTPHQVAAIVQSMTITSPALWIVQLSTLLIYSLLSVVPVAIYLTLASRR